ncbi:MAG TPA: hypothetical protein PKC18_07585 [Lacipirellulaceae bacterium]|nr:hypothetical protein [Lacipirellulaceae bacterium]HMP05451.1 hypothetical protein [Lacipirellulaceae bacterium]
MARPDGAGRDIALLRIVESWDELPSHIRSAVLTLIDAASVSTNGSDCRGGAS